VVHEDGSMATDSAQILQDLKDKKAALLTAGRPRRADGATRDYAWRPSVEILCAAFRAGPFSAGLTDLDAQASTAGSALVHFLMAMDIEHFVPLQEFQKGDRRLVAPSCGFEKVPAQTGSIRRGKRILYAQRVQRRGWRSRPGCSAT